jgi:dynein heavy chain, axonemal
MCGYRVVTITITGGYGLGDLLEDVKRMYTLAGLKDEGLVFLLTDAQVTHERFLVRTRGAPGERARVWRGGCMPIAWRAGESTRRRPHVYPHHTPSRYAPPPSLPQVVLNDMLASGSVPGLFAPDEEDAVVAAMAPKVKAATGVAAPDRSACWAHFLAAVRANLHVVLCFSPVGDDFRARAKRFPALTNNTVIDWFHPWPREALHSVAAQFMRGVDLGPLGLPNPDAVRDGIVAFMPFAFDTVNRAAARFRASDRRAVYTTPKSFLECLHTYKALLGRRHAASEAARARLASGLAKLRDTATAVSKIEEALKVSLLGAEEKRVVAEGIASEVLASKTVVEGETAKAAVLADECAAIAARATGIREDAERDLAAAIPAVEKAMEALNTLDKKDLAEAKT